MSDKKGESTDISNLLDEVELKYSDRNLLAFIVVSSDGLYNKGSNPLYHKFSKSVPIYSIIGDTSIFKDVSISNVLHNEISFLDNISPIEVQIKQKNVKERLLS